MEKKPYECRKVCCVCKIRTKFFRLIGDQIYCADCDPTHWKSKGEITARDIEYKRKLRQAYGLPI